MDPNVQNTIISGIVTIIVGIITALAAYLGAIKGAKTQIEHEKNMLKKQQQEQSDFTKAAIQEFIMEEIKHNFNKVIENNTLSLRLKESTPIQYSHNLTFKKDEFEKFKHELIKSKSDLVEKILFYYRVFSLLEEKSDLKMFEQYEFEDLKKALSMYISSN